MHLGVTTLVLGEPQLCRYTIYTWEIGQTQRASYLCKKLKCSVLVLFVSKSSIQQNNWTTSKPETLTSNYIKSIKNKYFTTFSSACFRVMDTSWSNNTQNISAWNSTKAFCFASFFVPEALFIGPTGSY